MVPNIDRGYSFKGVTAYLTHDKRGQGAGPESAARVGFTQLYNFIGDEARNPGEAAALMALVVRDADQLKAAAGIKPGGRKSEKGPVWHASLAWHPSEAPAPEDMRKAVEEALVSVGLPLDAGHQTYVVQHTDAPHPHVHIVVNLVHPVTGKQANPYRDLPKAQAWADRYEKERGHIFCQDRAAKYERRRPTEGREDAFNRAASSTDRAQPGGGPDRRGASANRRKPQQAAKSRTQQQAHKASASAEAAKAAADIRARFSERYAAQRTRSNEGYEARRAEATRFYQDRRAARDAIYQKFAHTLDQVWKPQAATGLSPNPGRDQAAAVFDMLRSKEEVFKLQEGSFWGRIKNASALSPSSSPFQIARIAFDKRSRQALFNRSQGKLRRESLPPRSPPGAVPQPKVKPETRKEQAARVKAMRQAELTAFDHDTVRQGQALKDRHAVEIANEKAAKAALAEESKAAWSAHTAQYGEAERPDPGLSTDRFGRSRNRRPETPEERAARIDAAKARRADQAARDPKRDRDGRDHEP